MTESPLVLEMTGVARSFGTGNARVQAVSGIDLCVAPGELVLIMGRSGSGKTTLLCLAGGLLRPDTGTIRVAGTDLTACNSKTLTSMRRDRIGFIFQRFNLLESLSALENVEVPMRLAGIPRRSSRLRAESLLTKLELQHRLGALPKTLSGGEQQRVAIARALANDPVLILSDEPTANLDSEQGRDVITLLRWISRESGRAVVIVSHDQHIREVADRVLQLEDGRLRAESG